MTMTTTVDFGSAEVLITGGSDGIGLGLARRFLAEGAAVLVTGRKLQKLESAAALNPGLKTFVSDIGSPEDREKLAGYLRETMPRLNIVINNAGVQRRIPLADDNAVWSERQAELDILLSGPVHLNHLLIQLLLKHERPSIIANVTSGGAYVPQPFAPMYSACKAALHSYTMNLRYALSDTRCSVVEIIPPAVRTSLAGPSATHGADLDDFCDTVYAALQEGNAHEIGYGMTAGPQIRQRLDLEHQLFDSMAGRFPVKTYG